VKFLSEVFPELSVRFNKTKTISHGAARIASSSVDVLSTQPTSTTHDDNDDQRTDNMSLFSFPGRLTVPDACEVLCPPNRFELRLQFRDVRTQAMTRAQYTVFCKAKDKQLSHSRAVVIDWLGDCMFHAGKSLYSMNFSGRGPEQYLETPRSCNDLLMFLMSDRISCLVEVAIRLRHKSRRRRRNTTSTQQLDVLSSLPKLNEVFEGVTEDSLPLSPNFYLDATSWFWKFIDTPMFGLQGGYESVAQETAETQLAPPRRRTAAKPQPHRPTPPRKPAVVVHESDDDDDDDDDESTSEDECASATALTEDEVFDAICREAIGRQGRSVDFPELDPFAVFFFFNCKEILFRRYKDGKSLDEVVDVLRRQYEDEKKQKTENYLQHLERLSATRRLYSGLSKMHALYAMVTNSKQTEKPGLQK